MAYKRSVVSDGIFYIVFSWMMAGAFALGIAFAYAELADGGWVAGLMIGGAVLVIGGWLFSRLAAGSDLPPPNTVKISAPPIKVPPAPTVPRSRSQGGSAAAAPAGAPLASGGLGDTLREKVSAAVDAVTQAGQEVKERVSHAAETVTERVSHATETVTEKAVDAKRAVADTITPAKPATLEGPKEGGPDDLKKIKGIGPKLETMLHELGYYHFEQIAAWESSEIAWVDSNLEGFNGRATRDDWVGQAKLLAKGEDTEFSKRVDEGDVY